MLSNRTSNPLTDNYIEAPTITNLSPNEGPTTGGTEVIITGTNLSNVTEVKFGNTTANFTINSDTQITTVSPSGEEGVVEVTIKDESNLSSAVIFTYTAPTNQSPEIGSFVAPSTIEIDQSLEFTWSVLDPDSSLISCSLDLGSYKSYDLGEIDLGDCSASQFKLSGFPGVGNYTYTLRVVDTEGLSASRTINVTVTENNVASGTNQVSFDSPEVQALWNEILAQEDITRLNWSFDASKNGLAYSYNNIISLIVFDSTGERVHIASGDGSLKSLHLWGFNLNANTLSLTNVLNGCAVSINNANRLASGTLSDSETVALAEELEGLTEFPYWSSIYNGFGNPQAQTSLLTTLAADCFSCTDFMKDFRMAKNNFILSVASIVLALYGTVATCGPAATLGGEAGCALNVFVGMPLALFAGVTSNFALVEARNQFSACLRINDPDLQAGSGAIAYAQPALTLIFVKDTVVDTIVASGIGGGQQAIVNTLYNARSNAFVAFEDLTDFRLTDTNGDSLVTLEDITVNENFWELKADWDPGIDPSRQCF